MLVKLVTKILTFVELEASLPLSLESAELVQSSS
jgi:hypothetical protein